MTLHLNPGQQKLAEKLIILNDRAFGMLTRIYNIKKACSDPKSKPTFLSDRTLEAALKHITRKFPTIDVRGGGKDLQAVGQIKHDIIKSLSLYYFTFVDLLDLKDHITELLTIMDACQVHLDITLNYDLTGAYLNLVVNYVSLMILLSRVEDRKAVLGLFNTAHEMQNGNSDGSFPRLGQMILDYDPPLRKLSDEFIPHARLLVQALSSLSQVYMRRNLTAEQWRSAQMLSLVAAPQQMLYAAQTDTIPCEYLSLDTMDRWIIFGCTLCHQQVLGQPGSGFNELWQKAMEGGVTLRLFRDETIHIHQYIQSFFETIKGYNKKVVELKEFQAQAVQNSAYVHRERRKFLRTGLKELCLVLGDQPGLLGPKVLFVFMGLSFARDEVSWLLRHVDNWPQKTHHSKGPRSAEDIVDRQIPELLFHMEELRGLILKYSQVIQRYYLQYLSGYDSIALNELIQNLPNVPEDESIILSSFCNSVAELSVDGLGTEAGPIYDFRGLRLDWCRLQAYTSVAKASLKLSDNRKLAYAMNTAVFHLKMVDFLDEMLKDTSDLSLYCFYTKQLETQFQLCLEFPSQTRYICAYPQLCTHFMNSLHELCPEERIHIGEKSLSFCNLFLDEMAKEAKNIITNISDQQCLLADKLLPKHCAKLIGEAMNQKKAKARPPSEKKAQQQGGKGGGVQELQLQMPGDESQRKNREEMTMMDKLYIALTELCYSINYYNQILVWEHTFAPKEYLTQHLENRFNKALVGMTMYSSERQEIAKPSEFYNSVMAYMSVFQSLENYVHIDITRVFNNVLMQQTQPQDSYGEETVTALYTRWYLEVLLRKVSASQILFSPHLVAFANNNTADPPVSFNAEEYTDFNELCSLAQVVGPFGIKFLSERLIWHVASQISELKKLVVQNKEVLRAMRTSFDKPERMRELFRQLTVNDATRKNLDVVDNLTQRVTIIGEILSFKCLLSIAIKSVLSDRIPYLFSSIADFKRTFPDEHPEQLAAFELCGAAGIECSVDAALVNAIRAQTQSDSSSEEDYHLCCLLMVFIAVSLPKLAKSESSFFRASVAAHLNNSHCIAKAVNAIAGALFTLHSRGDVSDRMKEFLALASGSLLRLNNEPEKDLVKSKESVYLLLDQLVDESPWLTVDLLESCFPYILLRSSYHYCYKQEEVHGTATI